PAMLEHQPALRRVGLEPDDRTHDRKGDERRQGDVDRNAVGIGAGSCEGLRSGGPCALSFLCLCGLRRRHGQTFSTSGLPSRPCGRKMSTTASIAKAATSSYSTEK